MAENIFSSEKIIFCDTKKFYGAELILGTDRPVKVQKRRFWVKNAKLYFGPKILLMYRENELGRVGPLPGRKGITVRAPKRHIHPKMSILAKMTKILPPQIRQNVPFGCIYPHPIFGAKRPDITPKHPKVPWGAK